MVRSVRDPEPLERAEPDPRPGFYYVSAFYGTRYALVSGPFPAHQHALDMVDRVRLTFGDLDDSGRSHWLEWGTCRVAVDAGPGRLDRDGLASDVVYL